jgi:hypothetical protein
LVFVTPWIAGLGHALLVCATETKLPADIETYAGALAEVLGASRAAA